MKEELKILKILQMELQEIFMQKILNLLVIKKKLGILIN